MNKKNIVPKRMCGVTAIINCYNITKIYVTTSDRIQDGSCNFSG